MVDPSKELLRLVSVAIASCVVFAVILVGL